MGNKIILTLRNLKKIKKGSNTTWRFFGGRKKNRKKEQKAEMKYFKEKRNKFLRKKFPTFPYT
jgi:hypothetical protein